MNDIFKEFEVVYNKLKDTKFVIKMSVHCEVRTIEPNWLLNASPSVGRDILVYLGIWTNRGSSNRHSFLNDIDYVGCLPSNHQVS